MLRLQIQLTDQNRPKRRYALVLLLVCLSLVVQFPLLAADANGLGPTFKTGHVFARGILLGENGQPIFVEYNEQGQVIQQFGEAVGPLEGARVISADDYRFQYSRYLDFLSEFGRTKAKAARILTREEYLNTGFGTVTLPDVNGESGDTIEVDIVRPLLDAGIQSVLVRDNKTVVTRGIAENDLLLFSSTIDLRDAINQLGEENSFSDSSTRSLLLNNRGQIVHRSSVDIGLRTAFWNRQDASQLSSTEFDGRNGHGAGDTPIAPIAEALVYPDMQWNSIGRTDENGQFSLYYFLPPCPGFSWFYDYNLVAEIPYRNFNPKSRAWQPWSVYYTTVPVGDRCDGTALNLSTATDLTGQSVYNTLVGINASSPQPIVRADMPIVANMLTGEGMLSNDGETPVELGERTEYVVDNLRANIPALPENLDLDANEVADDVRIGADGKVEVRFDASSEDADFTRVIDTLPDFSNQGLLKTLKPEDLSDTDLYVYRQSTGQLLVDREGLKEEEYGIYNLICAETDPDCIAEGQEPTNSFFYQMLIRGRWYYDYLAGALPDYQSKTRINSDLRGLDSNHLRAGEEIKLVAINRKTGYIGTAVAKVKAGGAENNALSFDIPPLMLQPPNLKIEAKRTLDVEAGLTKGEERKYTIGSEGAGLTSDKTVVVTTEWVDQDGSPLPEDLPGYTGRLAQIIDTNELGAPTSKLSNFAIRPGRRTQIVRLTENDVLGREHFYIHVSGEPIDGNPSFARTQGAGEGLLQFRPDYYVPIRVPVFDEAATREARNQLRYAQKAELTDLELDDIDPVYQWPHRPEMHFSVFDLDVNRIAGIDESTSDIHPDVQTIIYDPNSLEDCERDPETLLQCFLNNADVVTFEYALFGDPEDPLPAIGPDRTLILSLGGEEVIIGPQYGADQTVRFEDPDHLRQLDTEDYLTIALYQNNDAENLLWEFDLVKAALVVDSNRDGVIQVEDDKGDPTASLLDSERRNDLSFMTSAFAQTTPGPTTIPKDVNSRNNPFRWWFNDDDDTGEVNDSVIGNYDIPGKVAPTSGPRPGNDREDIGTEDAKNGIVDGMRDLVDFFPVYLDIKKLAKNFPPDEYDYRLFHDQEALRFVETELKIKTSVAGEEGKKELQDAYLKYPDVARLYADDNSRLVSDSGTKLSENFIRRLVDNDEGVILVEASSKNFDQDEDINGRTDCDDIDHISICRPLKLKVFKKSRGILGLFGRGKSVAGEVLLHVSIRGVEKMTRHLNLIDVIPGEEEKVADRLNEPDNYPDALPTDKFVAWVSGYNVSEQSHRGWQSEVFKRLYQLGFKGGFIGVTWAGDTGGSEYAKAIYHALETGKYLGDSLRSALGAKDITVLAHSAGNLVVSNAIESFGFRPNKYIMIDAAVPMEAYDKDERMINISGVEVDMEEKMTEAAWLQYANVKDSSGNKVLFASDWHHKFEIGDLRSELTWKGIFSNIFDYSSIFNFYSNGEEVLQNSFGNESFSNIIDRFGLELLEGRYAWTGINILMGCQSEVTQLGSYKNPRTSGPVRKSYCSGGWGFNNRRSDLAEIGVLKQPIDQENPYRLPDFREALQRYPTFLSEEMLGEIGFFRPFVEEFEPLYASGSPNEASAYNDFTYEDAQDVLLDDTNKHILLTHSIPVESFATGANPLSLLGSRNNYSMNNFQNGWPLSRTQDANFDGFADWLHSDIRNVSSVFSVNIYKKIISVINE